MRIKLIIVGQPCSTSSSGEMNAPQTNDENELDQSHLLPVELAVQCSGTVFEKAPIQFDRWAPVNYLVGPNGSGKTTLFKSIMEAARKEWPNRVKILGTGRLSPLEKSIAPWIGDPTSRLFQEDDIAAVYNQTFSDQDTSHQAFQLLEKRLDLQIRVLGFLRHVFKKTIHFKSTRKGLQILGASDSGSQYQIIDECHGLKELITILTFLYDDTFSVIGIDEPELHLHPQFQRFLLDELRLVAGSPDEKGKKLIFLVTHSPIFLELRHLRDLSSVIVFSLSTAPQRVQLSELSDEELIKVRQALPSFHAAQRELLFCNAPIVVEGPTDSAILLNVATKLELPLGAAGLGVASMGGKYQLLAFRALLKSLAKPNARFILDLDAVTDTKVLHCLDSEAQVIEHLASAGFGERTLSKVAGELIGLLREFVRKTRAAGKTLGPIAPNDTLTERELAVALRVIKETFHRAPADLIDQNAARTILGKFDLIRAAARTANVLILSNGPIEAYYQSSPALKANDYEKQQAFLAELDAIWNSQDLPALKNRYSELLVFVNEAGLLKVPLGDMVREPLADLIYLLQKEILTGRVATLEQARQCSRAVADGYWDICELTDLHVASTKDFKGTINVKLRLGGESVTFDHNTRAYELTVRGSSSDAAAQKMVAADATTPSI